MSHRITPFASTRPLPTTRYQGSKAKLVEWIGGSLLPLAFDSVLDLFGGTGSVSYYFKSHGKRVVFNDCLASNAVNGLALIENGSTLLHAHEIDALLQTHSGVPYAETIAEEFRGLFYPDEENRWLDVVVQNIHRMDDPVKRALAHRALFQACIIKRPYNLFHRANLNMRTREVQRSFGNKTTWETPFEEHFRKFVEEGHQAVFDNGRPNRVTCQDALALDANADLVYVDPPYLNAKGVGVDYFDYYHFLEGILDYENWPARIDRSKKHKPILHEKPPWSDPARIHNAFQAVLEKFEDSLLAVSYRSNGMPSIDELAEMLRRVKGNVRVEFLGNYTYALSKTRSTQEVLLVGG